VAAVGEEVAGFVIGAPIVAEGVRSCGQCPRCSEGRTNLCTMGYAETGFTEQGAFATYVRAQLGLELMRRCGVDTTTSTPNAEGLAVSRSVGCKVTTAQTFHHQGDIRVLRGSRTSSR